MTISIATPGIGRKQQSSDCPIDDASTSSSQVKNMDISKTENRDWDTSIPVSAPAIAASINRRVQVSALVSPTPSHSRVELLLALGHSDRPEQKRKIALKPNLSSAKRTMATKNVGIGSNDDIDLQNALSGLGASHSSMTMMGSNIERHKNT